MVDRDPLRTHRNYHQVSLIMDQPGAGHGLDEIEKEEPVDFNNLFQLHEPDFQNFHVVQDLGTVQLQVPHSQSQTQSGSRHLTPSICPSSSSSSSGDLEEQEVQNFDDISSARSKLKRMKKRMKEFNGVGPYPELADKSYLEVDATKLPYYMNLINQINEDIANNESQEQIKETKRIAKVVEFLNTNETDFLKPRRKRQKKLLKNFDEEDTQSSQQLEILPSPSEPSITTKEKQTTFIDPEACPGQGAKLPECTSCQQMFQRPKEYFEHVQTVHADQLPFPCKFCSKRFRTETLLRQHIRYHGEKKFSCKLCGEKFLFEVTLRRHERIHSGEKPYVCCVCSKGFKQPNHLTTHQLTHNEEKNFKCISCDKSFKRRDVLVRHCRTKNHVCC